MFDPSKLDLDLDNLKKKNIPVPKEAIQKALKKVESPKKVEPSKEIGDKIFKDETLTDILDTESILKEESTDIFEEKIPEVQPETKTVHEVFMEDDAKRDKIKAAEKIQAEEEERKEDESIIWDITDVINNNQKIEEAEAKINARVKLNTDLIDINITSFQDILDILLKESYDLFILEPRDNDVKISFRQEKVEKDVKYIKFPIYNQIILKAKSITDW